MSPNTQKPHSTSTGAIRSLGANPETAPVMLHPGDAIGGGRRALYIIILGALTALGPFTVDLYLPAFPILEQDFQTSAAMIQLTLTGTMLGFAAGQLIVGPMSDKLGRRWPLLAATMVHIVASLVAAASFSLELLMVSRVFMGFGAAASAVVAMAMVRDLFGGKRLVVMLSRLALVGGLAPILAPLIGSGLLVVMSWHGIFLVLAGYSLVMLVCTIFILPETLPKSRRGGPGTSSIWSRYRSVFKDRVFIGVLIVGSMTFSGLFSYLSASPFLFQQGYRLSEQQYGLMFAANSIGIVLGVQIASRLAARYGPQWVLAFSTASLLLAAATIIVTDQLHLGMWGTIVPLFWFMTSCGFTTPCVQVLALDRHGKAAGTAASLLGAANFGIAALVTPLAAMISGASAVTATSMAMVMAGCSAVAIIALWALVRPRTVAALNP